MNIKDKLTESTINALQGKLIENDSKDNHLGEYYIVCNVMIDVESDRERRFDIAIQDNKPVVIIPEQNDNIETTYFKNLEDVKKEFKRINIKDIEKQIPMDYDYIALFIYQIDSKWSSISSRVD